MGGQVIEERSLGRLGSYSGGGRSVMGGRPGRMERKETGMDKENTHTHTHTHTHSHTHTYIHTNPHSPSLQPREVLNAPKHISWSTVCRDHKKNASPIPLTPLPAHLPSLTPFPNVCCLQGRIVGGNAQESFQKK